MASFKAKVGSIWKNGQRIFVNVGGVWKPVKKAHVKVAGAWKPFYAPAPPTPPITVFALGLSQREYPIKNGVYVNGGHVAGAGQNYNLATFNPNGTQIDCQQFNLNQNGFADSSRMIANLDAMTTGQVFALFSHSDSATNHTVDNIPASVTRVGGTSIYSGAMNFGGAYLLVGKVGSPPLFEQYIGGNFGPTAGDPAAFMRLDWQIVNGIPVLF